MQVRLAFTVGISILTALLFALIPAFHAWKENVSEVLSHTARNVSRSSRLRNALAAGEIALSLVLLTGAGLMMRTLQSLMSADLGFRPDHLLVMRMELPEHKYKEVNMAALFNTRLLEAVRQVPGVQSAALANALGASPAMVVRLILQRGVAMAVTGIAAGLCVALALTGFMRSLIFGVDTNDPFTLVVVSALLVLLSVIASYVPALRAARVDPVQALRAE